MEGIFRDINNPRIKYKKIDIKSNENKKEEVKKEEVSKVIKKEEAIEKSQINSLEYIARICRENKTQLIVMYDKQSQPIISPDLSRVALKCPYNHPHMINICDIDDGTAKCPTCSIGSVFSRKIVSIMRGEFDVNIILKDPQQNMKQDITYYNPINKIEIVCAIDNGADNHISGDILTIYIHSKPKTRMVTFLKNVLLTFKKISAPIYYPLAFAEDASLNYYGNGLIEKGTIVDARTMMFENC